MLFRQLFQEVDGIGEGDHRNGDGAEDLLRHGNTSFVGKDAHGVDRAVGHDTGDQTAGFQEQNDKQEANCYSIAHLTEVGWLDTITADFRPSLHMALNRSPRKITSSTKPT